NETLDALERDWARLNGHDGSDGRRRSRRVLVLNKVDRLEDQTELAVWYRRDPQAVPISAVTGQGIEALTARVLDAYRGEEREVRVAVPMRDGKTLSFLENRSQVLDREYVDSTVTMRVRIGSLLIDRLKSAGARVEAVE